MSRKPHRQVIDVGGEVRLGAARDDPIERPERDDADDRGRHGVPRNDPSPRWDRGGRGPLHVRNRGARLAASTTFVIASGNWVSLPSSLTHWWPMLLYNREMFHRSVAAHWSELTAASAFVSKRQTVSEALLFGPAAK